MKVQTLIIDIETDSNNAKVAGLKWFGGYDPSKDEYYLLRYDQVDEVKKLVSSYNMFIGYNIKKFDLPILHRHGIKIKEYDIVRDLYDICKSRLPDLGFKLQDYKLSTVMANIGVSGALKGELDYEVLKKEDWTASEIKQIKAYLKQDLHITYKLLVYLDNNFAYFRELISQSDAEKFKHLSWGKGSLAYNILCYKLGVKPTYNDKENNGAKKEKIEGGHHINHKKTKHRGNIIQVDLASAYPHALIQNNLFSNRCNCCSHNEKFGGNDFYKLHGSYCKKKQGRFETEINTILVERLKAKKKERALKNEPEQKDEYVKQKNKNFSLKLTINSIYGAVGNSCFKELYEISRARDVTLITRNILRHIAAALHAHGVEIIYGFTDSIFIKIPEYLDEETVLIAIKAEMDRIKSQTPFPKNTFTMGVDGRYKFIWFPRAQNCYLWVTDKDEVGYKTTLFPSNTSQIVMKTFEDYIKPRVIKELDVRFTKEEILEKLKELATEDIKLVCRSEKVKESSEYKSKVSKQWHIADKYGQGTHLLIENLKGIGAGNRKKYCTLEEFEKHNLTLDDVNFEPFMRCLKPFYSDSSEFEHNSKQD